MAKNKSFILLMTFISFVSMNYSIYAQEAEVDVSTTAKPKEATDTETTAAGNVTMDFKDADIANVLRILSYKGGVNIVAGPEVTGLVTIRLTDVPWDRALDVVLRTYGFAYERDGNIIRVTTTESLKQEELTTEVFALNYAKAEEVIETIKEMLTERGKIKFDERTNVVVATDIPTNLYKIRQVIEKLDRRTPQILIEAKIIETKLEDDEYLGIDWDAKITATGAKRPTTLPWSDKWYKHKGMYPEPLSTRTFTGGSGAGTTTSPATITVASNFPIKPNLPSTLDELREMFLGAFPMAASTDFTFGALDFTEFQAVLQYLETRADTDILSNPRITTLNNKEAVIHIGDTMLFPTFERNDDTGQLEISGFTDEREVGVILRVTPYVNEQKDIVLKLKPEVSSFEGITTLDESRGIVAPIFDIREADAEVMIRDGDTIMLGGLITKQTVDTVNKLPLLGDIPLIGKSLFSKKEKVVDRHELIIFISVHLVKDKWATHLDPSTALVPIPEPRDKEVDKAIPEALREKKKKFWETW